jgi:hypothetical protein
MLVMTMMMMMMMSVLEARQLAIFAHIKAKNLYRMDL